MVGTVETKRRGITLLFGMFQVVLGSTLPSGLYAIYERDWELSRIQSTLVFASYVAGVLCSLIFLGSLADRIGRKPAIVLSVALAALSSLTFLGAIGLPLLVVARLLCGLSVGICTGAFTSALIDNYGRRHGSALSAVVTSAALASGPLASALIAVGLPLPLRLPFIVHLMILLVVLISCLRLPDNSARQEYVKAVPKDQEGTFPTRSALFVFVCCAFVIGWAYGANGMWQSVVPLSMHVIHSQLQIACITTLMLGASAITQGLTLRQQPEKILPTGLLLLALGFAITAYGITTQQVWIVIGATILVGGQGMAFRSSLSLVAHSAPPHKQATAISLYYIFGFLMTAALPLITNVSGVVLVLYIMVIVTLASLLTTRLITR